MRYVSLVVEGVTDQAVVQRLLYELGIAVGKVHVTGGTGKLDRHLAGYNHAARRTPWLVVRDLDRDAPCPPMLLHSLLPRPAEHMRLRIAVRAVEAWLLADRTAIGGFLGVSVDRVPVDPDVLDDPKKTLVDLARRSRRSEMKMMAPSKRSGRRVGTAYTDLTIEFAATRWRPLEAAKHSPSLRRTIQRLRAWEVDGRPLRTPPER